VARLGWRVFVSCVLAVVVQSATLTAARAQDEAASYTSPTYGYSLTWSADWEVVEQESEGGYDLLHLVNQTSDVYIEGYIGDGGDPATCVESTRVALSDESNPDGVTMMTDEDGQPLAGEEDGSAYAIFDLSGSRFAEDAGYAAYVECRTLRPGVAVLAVTAFLPLDDFDAQAEQVDNLLGSISLPEGGESALADATELESFEKAIADDLTSYWTEVFGSLGQTYQPPVVTIFDEPVQTACGEVAPEEVGPFYCPEDQTVYLDQSAIVGAIVPFGDFVVGMVIAHEVGHHVQYLLGLEGCTERGCGGRGGSLAVELQADCFAGAWAQNVGDRGVIEPGAIEQTVIALAAFSVTRRMRTRPIRMRMGQARSGPGGSSRAFTRVRLPALASRHLERSADSR